MQIVMGTRVDLEMKRGVNELGVQGVQGSPVEGIYAGSATKITREAGIGTGRFEMRNQKRKRPGSSGQT